jgi:LacI family transcriptional regulator
MVTSRDVAKVAGVSQATVSRVINRHATVDPTIRTRVLAAMESTGYVLNVSAKAMRTQSAGAIGVVTSEIQNPFLPYLLDALTRAASRRSLTLVVWNDDDPDAPNAREGLASRVVDGIIFTAATTASVGMHDLIRQGRPVVLCNRAAQDIDIDVVMSDHYGSGQASARYLLGNGHTSIAAIFGPDRTYASPARQAGFRQVLDEAGIPLLHSSVVDGQTSYEAGHAGAMQMLDSGERPDAIFCSSDIIAFGALDAFRSRGVRVPDDLWVCGVDGLPMAAWSAFDLTTQQQDVEAIAEASLDRLLERVGGTTEHVEHLLIPTGLVVRGSTEHMPWPV